MPKKSDKQCAASAGTSRLPSRPTPESEAARKDRVPATSALDRVTPKSERLERIVTLDYTGWLIWGANRHRSWSYRQFSRKGGSEKHNRYGHEIEFFHRTFLLLRSAR